jgi:Metallo-peptidase family M12B Reprolysin-like
MSTHVLPLNAVANAALLSLACLAATPAHAIQPWVEVAQAAATAEVADRQIHPTQARWIDLDMNAVQSLAASLPSETQAAAARHALPTLTLPMPDGEMLTFTLHATEVMAPALAARYPQIRTFAGTVSARPHIRARFDLSPRGLRAQIFTPQGEVYIDPLSRSRADRHQIYYTRHLTRSVNRPADRVLPTPHAASHRPALAEAAPTATRIGAKLFTYRIAFATTGEYAKYHDASASANNKALVLAEIVNVTNRVTGVYERDLGIRLQLVDNTDALIYTNASTDPYANNNGDAMLGQNIATLKKVLGNANFDIGHVLSTGGGGIAYMGVCDDDYKAGGVTGSSDPITDAFYIDYVAHEIGHQFAADHTFNSIQGSCEGNRAADQAYEPGSGTTIMAYAGICGADDIAEHSDANFHAISVNRIVQYTRSGWGSTCGTVTNSGNKLPLATVPTGGFTIPIDTPFELTGQGTDANGDALTYQWEQMNLGAAGSPNAFAANAPLFRSYPPSTSPTRVFPKMSDLLANRATLGEKLPKVSRTLNFRLTVRDNRVAPSSGGLATADLRFNVSAAAGPFRVTAPNVTGSYTGGAPLSVA